MEEPLGVLGVSPSTQRPSALAAVWEAAAASVRNSPDKPAACAAAGAEVIAMANARGASDVSLKQYFKLLRREIARENPDLDAAILPKCPPEVFRTVSNAERGRVRDRCDAPIIIRGDDLITLAVAGLEDGMVRWQVPQVLFCLSYLVALRPNDLNVAFVRQNGVSSGPETHVVARPGTLLNLAPSKACPGARAPRPYATALICDPKHYETVERALRFVQTSEIAALPPTRKKKAYLEGFPSGPEVTGTEWGTHQKGVRRAMLDRLGFEGAVQTWGAYRGGFTKQLGRSFVASCVEQGRFQLEPGLNPTRAVELLLGHEPLSSTNVNYLRCDVRPSKVHGVLLRKVEPDRPFHGLKYGVRVDSV